jgi:hypothetical protein
MKIPDTEHLFMHTYIHTYTHTYIHTYIHKYIHTYISLHHLITYLEFTWSQDSSVSIVTRLNDRGIVVHFPPAARALFFIRVRNNSGFLGRGSRSENLSSDLHLVSRLQTNRQLRSPQVPREGSFRFWRLAVRIFPYYAASDGKQICQ